MKVVSKRTARRGSSAAANGRKGARASRSPVFALRLTADAVEVKAGAAIAVNVGFKGVEKVELALVPAGTFAIDLKSVRKPGLVRLRGKKDGKATLFARGFAGGEVVLERKIHVACEGPRVRVSAFGYRHA